MGLETIKGNTVIYSTELYGKYNLYLIDEHKKFMTRVECVPTVVDRVNRIILKLQDILDFQTEANLEHPFRVMDWEESLISYYTVLDNTYKQKGMKSIMSITNFLRKIKLEKLKSL